MVIKKKEHVHFSVTPPQVHLMLTWNYAYREARKGECWMQLARDRDRFLRRVHQYFEPIISKVLSEKINRIICRDKKIFNQSQSILSNDKIMSSFIIIDLQGYNISNPITVKEMTFYDGKKLAHYVFQAPQPFQDLDNNNKQHVRYLEFNHSGIKYSDGFVEYKLLSKIIKSHVLGINKVYVKGKMKADLLNHALATEMDDDQENLPVVINLEDVSDITTPNLIKEFPACMHHFLKNTKIVCSLNNCKILYNFISRMLP